MEKKVFNKFGKHYLLGLSRYGEYVCLEEPSWDCGWYWGFGYLHTFTNSKQPMLSRDIQSHTHFDRTFLNKGKCSYDVFKEYFEETVLSDSEIWLLLDYMRTFYCLKDAAEIFHIGHSNYTEKAKIDALQNAVMCKVINHELLPQLFDKIRELLSGKED